MLDIGARMESKAASQEDDDGDPDSESIDLSFEELLAQEKKDSFWYSYRVLAALRICLPVFSTMTRPLRPFAGRETES